LFKFTIDTSVNKVKISLFVSVLTIFVLFKTICQSIFILIWVQIPVIVLSSLLSVVEYHKVLSDSSFT